MISGLLVIHYLTAWTEITSQCTSCVGKLRLGRINTFVAKSEVHKIWLSTHPRYIEVVRKSSVRPSVLTYVP